MDIIYLDTVDSTNNYAKAHLVDLIDQTVIVAKNQTNGRGQFERKWVDLGSENIYMTIVLKPSEEFLQHYVNLTKYLADCLCELIQEIGVNPRIKLPNDVLINGKKVAGILAETITQGNKSKGIALGIGINLNASVENLSKIDLPATALNIELGKDINKHEFLHALLGKFFAGYDVWLNQKNIPANNLTR